MYIYSVHTRSVNGSNPFGATKEKPYESLILGLFLFLGKEPIKLLKYNSRMLACRFLFVLSVLLRIAVW